MNPEQAPGPLAVRSGLTPWRVVLLGLVFALAYSQSPLYTSNQNQYFLHGAARAGIGFLSQDWLANTTDPVPVFSLLVEWTYRLLSPWAFYLYQVVLLALYLVVLTDLAWLKGTHPPSRSTRTLFFLFVIGLHSAALRTLLVRLLGPEWGYLFDGGVAGQRLLGTVFQPSVFGVLLLGSIALYMRGRPLSAVTLAAAAATIHPTYLLSAALLTGGFMLECCLRTRRFAPALTHGAWSLILALPITLYVLLRLGPTGPQLAQQAQQILVEVRIPHHAVVRQWLDATVLVKLAWIGAGLALSRQIARLFPVLAWLAGASACLTLIQVYTGSTTLALLFPWRVSAVLVPIATALIAAWAARHAARSLLEARPRPAAWAAALGSAIVAACAVAGVVGFALEVQQQRQDPARSMFAFVEKTRDPGQVYLIPPRLQDFRLATGAPALVDFKSIPYRDVEVLEWYERLRLSQWFFRDRVEDVDCGLLDRMTADYGVTHAVLDRDLLGLACPVLSPVYRDESYLVARIRGE